MCRVGETAAVARAALHFDEEPCISGTGGAGTVFFSGCALRCIFCQNEKVSHGCFGLPVSESGLLECFHRLIGQGAENIDLVTPSHHSLLLRKLLQDPLPVPVVWNSSGYEKAETLRKLEGCVQVYLPDLKYMDAESAGRYSGAPDYFRWASGALLEMYRQQPRVVLNGDGVMQRGLLVRHLILPGHAEESMRILDWIHGNLPGAWVSVMAQYTPFAQAAGCPPLDRRLTEEEYQRVVDHMLFLGIEDGYVQELSSSDEQYIPSFDLTGVRDLTGARDPAG